MDTDGYFPLIANSEPLRWFVHYFAADAFQYGIEPLILADNSLELISFMIQVMKLLDITGRLSLISEDNWKFVATHRDLGALLIDNGKNISDELREAILEYRKHRPLIVVPLIKIEDLFSWSDLAEYAAPPKKWPSWIFRQNDWPCLLTAMLQRLYEKYGQTVPLSDEGYKHILCGRYYSTVQVFKMLDRGFQNFLQDKSQPANISELHLRVGSRL